MSGVRERVSGLRKEVSRAFSWWVGGLSHLGVIFFVRYPCSLLVRIDRRDVDFRPPFISNASLTACQGPSAFTLISSRHCIAVYMIYF